MSIYNDPAKFSRFQSRTGMRPNYRNNQVSTYIMEKSLIRRIKDHVVETTDYMKRATWRIAKDNKVKAIFHFDKVYDFEQIESVILGFTKIQLIEVCELFDDKDIDILPLYFGNCYLVKKEK